MENKTIINIYEPPMCCSSGVCGPSPDTKLMDLQNTIKRIQKEFPEVQINRYSMNFNPKDFMQNPAVFAKVKAEKTEALPIITINGDIIKEKDYMSYDEFIKELMLRK
ncbi:Arsenical resistance operon trans-acting repressor ArsD [Geosporobacter subterraneus DSM 17957]|uniref:Arsenical resistance operon trans-acting repressor ArsD n=1 Tax=Geosporobacter subterraneus DSM 17957 TaxID=1121919 RepID=A0A1M6PXX8_9FIRM|nr:arsenite efflux transporter metallochaperone ArsD [Geosporobacter subterraneus]SHK12788.1 Arsenical resistance operon trans-acting repressor ArsD [Geosporobacter subterraneus DSM 17957]